jgi:hypothetical protein
MKKSLEQTLIDKCKELAIDLDMNDERIWVDVSAPRIFGTTLTHWEHCIIESDRDYRPREEKFSFQKSRNQSMRVILEAIETLTELADGEKCHEQDCDEC